MALQSPWLGRRHYLPVPGVALKILLCESADLVLKGHRVVPKRANTHGYPFLFPDLVQALRDLWQ